MHTPTLPTVFDSDLGMFPGDGNRFEAGTRIRQYEIIRLIGEGGMGVVYLARDTVLGRRAALKLLRTENVEHSKNLLREARTTAQLTHDHVVVIYEVNAQDGMLFLALEYLEGYTLSELAHDARVTPRRAVEIIVPVVRALAHAHRNGVVHRDLKPSNIFVTDSGGVKVLDFGIARYINKGDAGRPVINLESESSESIQVSGLEGSVPYMAPEQLLTYEVGPLSDIWSVGVILYELIIGRHPVENANTKAMMGRLMKDRPIGDIREIEPSVPDRLAEILNRCLEKYKADRYQTAQELLTDLEAFSAPYRPRRVKKDECPYPGLSSFKTADAHMYFGRFRDTMEVVERLRQDPLVCLAGPTGIGKSSFVKAGIVPALTQQEENWQTHIVRPGRDPMTALAALMTEPDGTSIELEKRTALLMQEPGQLGTFLRERARATERRTLVVVDPLEELYTLTNAPEVRASFIACLSGMADDLSTPLRVLVVVRSDFLDRTMEDRAFGNQAAKHLVLLGPVDRAGLREALVHPAERAGYTFESEALVDELLDSVEATPGSLPLLQFAAVQLWEARDKAQKKLTESSLESIGGLVGALTSHADQVVANLERFSPNATNLTRAIFRKLVTPDRTRALTPLEDLLVLSEDPDDVRAIVDRLTEARLLVVQSPDDGRGPTVELVHDSLIHNWTTLNAWIEGRQEQQIFLQQLTAAATMWDKRGRRPEEVWRKETLQETVRELEQVTGAVPKLAREFVQAGQDLERRGRLRRRRFIFVSFAALGVVALSLFLAWQQAVLGWREAQRQQAQARFGQAVAEQEGAGAAFARGQMLEARAKLRSSLEIADSASARSLWWRLVREPVLWKHELSERPRDIVFSPDGAQLAVSLEGGKVRLYDVKTRETRVFETQIPDGEGTLAYSPDGQILAMTIWNGGLVGLSTNDGAMLFSDLSLENAVNVGFVDSGKKVMAILHGGNAIAMRLNGERVDDAGIQRTPLQGMSTRVIDGKLLEGGFQGKLRLTDLQTGQTLYTADHGGFVVGVDLSSASGAWASASRDGIVRLWSSQGKPMHRVATGPDRPSSLAFSVDGHWLAVGGYQGHVRILQTDSGEVVRSLKMGDDQIMALEWSSDGRHLAVAGGDRHVMVLNAEVVIQSHELKGHSDSVLDVAFTHDGRRIISGGRDQSVRIFDAASGRVERIVQGADGPVNEIATNQDDTHLAWASRSVQITPLDLRLNPRMLQQRGINIVQSMAFDPSGPRIAVVVGLQGVRVYDYLTERVTWDLETHLGSPRFMSFSPDGRRLILSNWAGQFGIWSTETQQAETIFEGHRGRVIDFDFDSTGRYIVSVGSSRHVKRFDLETAEILQIYQSPVEILRVRISNDDQRVLLAGQDGFAYMVDMASGEVLRRFRSFHGPVHSVDFSPDGQWVALASADTSISVFNTQTGMPRWRAPALLGTTLVSHQGWVNLETRVPVPVKSAWARSVSDAQHAVEDPTGRYVCVVTAEHTLQVWDMADDRAVRVLPISLVQKLGAFDEGCIVMEEGSVFVVPFDNAPKRALVLLGATTFAPAGGRKILVAQTATVTVHELGRMQRVLHVADDEVTAIHMNDDILYLGLKQGSLHEVGADGEVVRLERTRSFPVTRIALGPPGTILAGSIDGDVGLWSMKSKHRLHSERLHGAVAHLAYRDGRVYAASELGASLVWNLDTFEKEWCALLMEVQERISVAWLDGRAVAREPELPDVCSSGP